MTYQEAIKVLKNNYPKTTKMVDGKYQGGFDDIESELGQALNIAIEALKKQIPKEPLNREDESTISYGYCPCCGNIIDDWNDVRRCGECGQAINWEENGMNTKIKDISGLVFDSKKQTMKSETITARVTKDDRGTTLSLADESGTGIMLVVPVEKIKEML